MHTLAGLALAIQADGLHLDDVVRLLVQVPEHAGPAGGVHLPDEALRVAVLLLRRRGGERKDRRVEEGRREERREEKTRKEKSI